jgi:hypothetical protein
LASTTKERAKALKTTSIPTAPGSKDEIEVVPNFAVFIDTHRDQPHVPTFEDDIHRGMSRPTLVHYAPPRTTDPDDLGALIRVEDNRMIDVDPKHRFVETEWWQQFVMDYLMEHGEPPVPTSGPEKGQLPTSHLRDARAKVYHLKSLRQIVRAWEKASATATGKPFKPTRVGKRAAAATTSSLITTHSFHPHPIVAERRCHTLVIREGVARLCDRPKESHVS